MTTHQAGPDVPAAAPAAVDAAGPGLVPDSGARALDHPAYEALADASARYWAAMDDPEAPDWERTEAAEALQEAEDRVHELRIAEPGVRAQAGQPELADHPGQAGASADVEANGWPGRKPGPEATREDGHVDPAAAGRWHQAQTELAGLIREDNRILDQAPETERALPGSLSDWMASRVAELEQAETAEPEAEP